MRTDPSPPAELAVDALKRARLRVTTARVDVFAALQGQPGFVRPEVLFRIWVKNKGHANISTIYRSLTDLSKAGVILRARDPQGRSVFAVPRDDPAESGVFLCLHGREPIPLQDAALRAYIEQAAQAAGIDLGDAPLHISPARPAGRRRNG